MSEKQAADYYVPDTIRRWLSIIVAALFAFYWIILTGALFAVFVWPKNVDSPLSKLIDAHFVAIVGLPTACLMSFCVVWLVRATEGPMEIEMIGLRLRGSSGPLLLWVVSFLAMAFALWLLW